MAVLFTKIWTAVLAVLATACLAGMYLLSTGSSGGFTEADKTAVRAVTEAGMAALASDVNGSPVSLGPSLLTDSRLKDALDPPAEPPPGKRPDPDADGLETPLLLAQVFEDVANESLLDEHPLMSVALIDKSGAVVRDESDGEAKTGLAPELFDELTKLPAMQEALKKEDAQLLSATLGGKLHAIKLSRPLAETQARRLVAIQAVELGGGSFFRRVVGTGNPSGLVRGKEVIGETVGGAKSEELISWVEAHIDEIPPEGASAVFEVGSGGEQRIGAAARVPGPAGKGKDATVFVVLSAHNLASTQKDMASALTTALNEGGLAVLNWPLVGGLLAISLVLTFYLPHIEFNAPMSRLQGELAALIEGRKHQIDHDTYGGMYGTLGRSISAVLEAQRVSLDAALVDSDVDSSTARRTRSTRAVRATSTRSNPRRAKSRDHKAVDGEETSGDDGEAIELPSAGGSEVERHAAADLPPAPRPPVPTPRVAPPPAPAFDESVEPEHPSDEDSDAITLAAATAGDRESYYQRIYTEFVETKTACGESVEGFTYEKFAKKLRKQSDDLLGRADVKDVEFSVYVKDGKAALRAKVIKA